MKRLFKIIIFASICENKHQGKNRQKILSHNPVGAKSEKFLFPMTVGT
jgi:hypothetical protein